MKKMAKLALTTGVLAASIAAQGASSGNLLLQGIVAIVNDIVINANGNATTLNILAGESNKLVATVDETSNNNLGYRIEMSSANAGKLVHTVNPARFTNYQVRYDGAAAVTLTNVPQIVKNVASLSGLATDTSNVNVDVTAYPTAIAGTYQDTVTISIVAN